MPGSKTYKFGLIGKYFQGTAHSGSLQVIDEKVCNDLDIEELFMFLDQTTSRPGQQYLYDCLRNIPKNDERTRLREKIIKVLKDDRELRENIVRQLKKLEKKEASYICSLFTEEHISQPRWFFVVPVLSLISVVSLVLLFFYPQLILLMLAIFIINLGIHYWNKQNLYPYLASLPQLLIMNRVAMNLHKLGSFTDISSGLDPALSALQKIKGRMAFFQLEARLQGDMEAIAWSLLEVVKIMFLLEPLLLFSVLTRLNSRREEVSRVFTFIGEVDLCLSILALREGHPHCIPEVREAGMEFMHLRHPLIVDCVPNSLKTNGRSVLLTGSNMSGKSSFIRATGINVLTGLTINTCFAASAILPRTRIYSAIRISDDLMNDKSYYFEEVLTIGRMLGQTDDNVPCLFLLDEIFKGTNTVERIAAGKAVLSALATGKNTVLVATHDVELTGLLEKEFDLYHFSELVDDQSIAFDYLLKDGRLKNRNAIRILKVNGYPDEIVEEAMQIAKVLDRARKNDSFKEE